MTQSLRGMGYTIGASIADVIDNSISAEASNIRIDFGWNGKDSFVRISDNGHGLTADKLDEAMVLGSTSPLESRSTSDLGRFGMGLKTAWLSSREWHWQNSTTCTVRACLN
ncbi:ATP-binding protein [Rhodanobacter sp. 115]|uniref:ATP-binding protein n=1 Tax=Rhodanobacter sp. FW021-MT20 TaxID=1162282 RepID=UPI0034E50DCF